MTKPKPNTNTLKIDVRYNPRNNGYSYSENLKQEKVQNMLIKLLRRSLERGIIEEYSQPSKKTGLYEIKIEINPDDDSFYIKHNCRDGEYRDGILLTLINMLEDKSGQKIHEMGFLRLDLTGDNFRAYSHKFNDKYFFIVPLEEEVKFDIHGREAEEYLDKIRFNKGSFISMGKTASGKNIILAERETLEAVVQTEF